MGCLFCPQVQSAYRSLSTPRHELFALAEARIMPIASANCTTALGALAQHHFCAADPASHFLLETSILLPILLLACAVEWRLQAEEQRRAAEHQAPLPLNLALWSTQAVWPRGAPSPRRWVVFALFTHRVVFIFVRAACSFPVGWPCDINSTEPVFRPFSRFGHVSGKDDVDEWLFNFTQAVLPLAVWCVAFSHEGDRTEEANPKKLKTKQVVSQRNMHNIVHVALFLIAVEVVAGALELPSPQLFRDIVRVGEPMMHHSFVKRVFGLALTWCVKSSNGVRLIASLAFTASVTVAGIGVRGFTGMPLLRRVTRCLLRVGVIFVTHAFISRVIYLYVTGLVITAVQDYADKIEALCRVITSRDKTKQKTFDAARDVYYRGINRDTLTRISKLRWTLTTSLVTTTVLYAYRDAVQAMRAEVDDVLDVLLCISVYRHIWHAICVAYTITYITVPTMHILRRFEESVAERRAFGVRSDAKFGVRDDAGFPVEKLDELDKLVKLNTNAISLKAAPFLAPFLAVAFSLGSWLSSPALASFLKLFSPSLNLKKT